MIETEQLDKFDFMDKCNIEQKKQLAKLFSIVYYRKYQPIYFEEESTTAIYLIEKGIVEMCLTSGDGQKIHTLGLLKMGDVFGFGEMFFDKYYISTISRSASVLLKMNREDFFDYFLNISILNRYVMEAFASIVRQKTLMTYWEKTEDKLPYLFQFLANNYGKKDKNRIIIQYKLTHEKLANILDISREHFSRIYLKLQKEDIIGKTSDNFFYINEDWLVSKHLDAKLTKVFKRMFSDKS